MSKQQGRGFVLHGFSWGCYNCCCRVCTGRACPERNKVWGWYRYHCAPCARSNGEMHIVLDCDFFENKHTSRRRFRIKRCCHRDGSVIARLDLIMKKLDISVPESSHIDDDAQRLVDDYNKGLLKFDKKE